MAKMLGVHVSNSRCYRRWFLSYYSFLVFFSVIVLCSVCFIMLYFYLAHGFGSWFLVLYFDKLFVFIILPLSISFDFPVVAQHRRLETPHSIFICLVIYSCFLFIYLFFFFFFV